MATDLLLITPGFPANEGDSTCIPPLQAYLLALRKSRPELRIAVIALQYPYTHVNYRWRGIDVRPCNGRIRWYWKPRTWRRASKAFASIHASGPVPCIHSLWLGEAAMLGTRFSKIAKAKHVLTLMGQDARDGVRWWSRLDQKPVAVCLSERHASTFHSMSGQAADAIVPWGIDPDRKERPVDLDKRDIDLLFCGSMIPVKQPEIFLEIVDRIRRARAIKAVMIGDGPERKEIDRQITERRLSGLVEMNGTIQHDHVLDRMARSRILVHPSGYEGNAQVFAEALASGMSIVSFDVGGAAPSARWRVAGDVDEMAAAVNDLLAHPPAPHALILQPVAATAHTYLRLYGLA